MLPQSHCLVLSLALQASWWGDWRLFLWRRWWCIFFQSWSSRSSGSTQGACAGANSVWGWGQRRIDSPRWWRWRQRGRQVSASRQGYHLLRTSVPWGPCGRLTLQCICYHNNCHKRFALPSFTEFPNFQIAGVWYHRWYHGPESMILSMISWVYDIINSWSDRSRIMISCCARFQMKVILRIFIVYCHYGMVQVHYHCLLIYRRKLRESQPLLDAWRRVLSLSQPPEQEECVPVWRTLESRTNLVLFHGVRRRLQIDTDQGRMRSRNKSKYAKHAKYAKYDLVCIYMHQYAK